jgi:protocadherin-16/23
VKEPKFLDFEVKREVQLIILAENSGHQAYSKVAVLVQDVNDNSPHFEQSVYHTAVSEGQLYNAQVIQVTETFVCVCVCVVCVSPSINVY